MRELTEEQYEKCFLELLLRPKEELEAELRTLAGVIRINTKSKMYPIKDTEILMPYIKMARVYISVLEELKK